jgi:hypothetical protein
MAIGRFFAISLALFAGSASLAVAQGLEQARAQLPRFTASAEGQTAELYVYYPSVDVMVKLETTAAPGVFSDVEFGYVVGDFHSVVSEFLASSWYSGYDEATRSSAARQLEGEAKWMRQPFQQPGATLATALDTAGVTFTYSGRAADGTGEVSFSNKWSWAEVAAQQE